MVDNVQITKGGLEFYDDEGVQRIMVRRQENLATDVYLDLPTSDGTLATQEFVAANSGSGAVTAYSDGAFSTESWTSDTTARTITGASVTLPVGFYAVKVSASIGNGSGTQNFKCRVLNSSGSVTYLWAGPGYVANNGIDGGTQYQGFGIRYTASAGNTSFSDISIATISASFESTFYIQVTAEAVLQFQGAQTSSSATQQDLYGFSIVATEL